MKPWRAALCLLGLLGLTGLTGLLTSCADEPNVVDGGGFGGETISGLVVGVSGRGISGATVSLRASHSLESTALRVASTDKAGLFRMELPNELPESKAFRLEVAGADGGDSVRALVDLDQGHAPGRILAEARAPRQVQLRDPAGQPVAATLHAYGLGRMVTSDAAGLVTFTGWPIADLWVRAELPNGEAHDLFIPAAGGEIEVGSGWLIDDFEGGLTRTRLGNLIGGGWWYVASQGTDSQSTRDIALARDTLDARFGRSSLWAKFAFDGSPLGYGLVGFHFGPTQADPVDLSGLDSLAFWIKGSGSVFVEFVADTGGGVASHTYSVTLNAVWTRHVVPASALSPVLAGRSWATDSKRIRFLQFIVSQAAEFRLDDLRYYGRERP